MDKKKLSLLALLIALALFFSVNLAAAALFRSTRLDLTENKLYTLSDGTKNILRGLPEPVTLRFYFSKKVASQIPDISHIRDYAQRVQEMLQEYKGYAGDKLTLYFIDPEPFSAEEDRAVGHGLQGAPANRAGELLYFGLAGTNAVDDREIVSFFQIARQEFLEYDLTRLIYRLAHPDRTVVGLLTALPVEGRFDPMNPMERPEPWTIGDQIRETAEVVTVSTADTEIPHAVDVFLAIHPKGLSEKLLFEIDQFVLRGGKLIAFLDPHCEADPVPQDPNNPLAAVSADRSSDLAPLLAAWGVRMPKDKIAADRRNAIQVGYQGKGVDYVAFLALDRSAMSPDDPITSQLDLLRFGSAGVLEPLPDATTTFTPLIQTSEESMQIDRMSVALYPDPTRLLGEFVPGDRRLTLAARVGGPARTAFPDGDPTRLPGNGDDGDVGDFVRESRNGIQVLLVSDADMLADQWWVRKIDFLGRRFATPTAGNGDFLMNAIDNMSGSRDLIGLRSRPSFGRPFERVAEIRRRADERFRSQERQLEERLREIEQRINDLQAQKGDGAVGSLILSPEQREQIEEARREQVATREKLRDVKHSLQKEIERLGMLVKALNVLVLPASVAVLALFLGLARTGRRKS